MEYTFQMSKWCLIYKKDKDQCLLQRNGGPVVIKKLSPSEVEAYKEVLDYAITYHHEKGDANTH